MRAASTDEGARDAGRALRPGEAKRVALAFASFFLVLCAYYVLRPVRDAMGVRAGADRMQWLFTATLVFTLLTVPLFGAVVRRVARPRLVPVVYGFLITNLVAFAAAFARDGGTAPAVAFFVWLSTFNLFAVSLFWSTASDAFTTEESHRLYGYVAAGGTTGAVAGPGLTALVAGHAGASSLLVLSAALLAAATACMVALRRAGRAGRAAGEGDARPVGGSIVAGIPLTWRVPSLRGVALVVIGYSAVSTVLYVELVDLVGARFAHEGERVAFFATIDLAVNGLALVVQTLGTSRIVRRFGLRAALAIVPLLVTGGLALLGAWRSATGVAMVQTVHRAGDYALVRPGREMVFTTVDAESRYKGKSFIDTTVYRANDALWAWLVAALRGAGVDAVVYAGIPAALLWLGAGVRLGRRHDAHRPS